MSKAGTHAGMSQTRDHCELIAKVLEDVEIGRERVVLAGLGREKVVRMQSERRTDANHTARRLLGVRSTLGVIRKDVEPWQGK